MSKKAVMQELLTVLDKEHATAVYDHRIAIKKPMTAYAAKRLAQNFAKCADPNYGADYMIDRGWLGFKPEWMKGARPTSNDVVHDRSGASFESDERGNWWKRNDMPVFSVIEGSKH